MVFLVAEFGVNWDGNFDILKKMLSSSKDVGFDAVKFQAFKEDMVKDHPEKERLLKTSITQENISKIDSMAKFFDIEWFCTPMYVEAVDFLDPFVSRYKIREFDGRTLLKNKSTPLFKKISDTKKEILISTQQIPSQIFKQNSRIKWLYCIPKYPCNIEELDFTFFQNFHGYSNHCNNPLALIIPSILGAEIIEVHVTLSKFENYVDNNVSFDFNEMKEIIRSIRTIEKIKLPKFCL